MNIFYIILGILLIIYIIKEVINKTFDIYESIFWIIATIAITILAIFPQIIDKIALKLGVFYAPSLLFLLGLIFLIFINFKQSKKLSEQQIKIIELSQHMAILEEKIYQEKEI